MKLNTAQNAEIILGMREVFPKDENAMAWFRSYLVSSNYAQDGNALLATLL